MRNPYDQIATLTRIAVEEHEERGKKFRRPIDSEYLIEDAIRRLFNISMQSALDIINTFNLDVLEVHLPNLSANPREEIGNWCKFFEVECYDWYVEMCIAYLYSKTHQTRHTLVWTSRLKQMVADNIKRFPWYKGYTFDSD